MGPTYHDVKHLVRAALLFGGGIGLFLVARGFLLPETFGDLGHYRAGALDDSRALAPVFAGHAACAECHADVREATRPGGHANVGCESCHGPAAAHAADPGSGLPPRPEAAGLCPQCHQLLVSRPRGFPQVDAAEHAGAESCTTCHPPHQPLPGGE